MKENCIVCLGIGKHYPRGVQRLSEQIKKYDISCDFFGYTTYPPDVPHHTEKPYFFKYALIDQKLKMGYKRVLWIDSSFYVLKNFNDIWSMIDKTGYLILSGGHPIAPYTNNLILKHYNTTREEATGILTTTGGFLGFRYDSPVALSILSSLITNSHLFIRPETGIDAGYKMDDQSFLALELRKNGINTVDLPKFDSLILDLNKRIPRKPEDYRRTDKHFLLDRQFVKR